MVRVLVTGASGYLGLFVVEKLASSPTSPSIFATFNSHPPSHLPVGVTAMQMEVKEGASIEKCMSEAKPDVIVHCAAIAQPFRCEQDKEEASAINCPAKLADSFFSLSPNGLFIFISTDQVFGGEESMSTPSTLPQPINSYGATKRAFEEYLIEYSKKGKKVAILRCSLIIGEERVDRKPTFLNFLFSVVSKHASALKNRLVHSSHNEAAAVSASTVESEKVSFFSDQYRCPIYVDDITHVIAYLIETANSVESMGDPPILHLGGPDRLSRVEMAKIAADVVCDASLPPHTCTDEDKYSFIQSITQVRYEKKESKSERESEKTTLTYASGVKL
mmetsp:Transcript_31882/g.83229  ORF Transcript_31882/g.83229 Transcript_31882/m.83229 type:complete len:333 (-) Transcript_31882:397-1395(-)